MKRQHKPRQQKCAKTYSQSPRSCRFYNFKSILAHSLVKISIVPLQKNRYFQYLFCSSCTARRSHFSADSDLNMYMNLLYLYFLYLYLLHLHLRICICICICICIISVFAFASASAFAFAFAFVFVFTYLFFIFIPKRKERIGQMPNSLLNLR